MTYKPNISISDATATSKGVVQLAGDLGGTADSPTVADNIISAQKITDGAVTEAKLDISNDPTANQALTWDGSQLVWQDRGITINDVPAGSTITVAKDSGTWPARPTDRTDVVVQWKGPDPSPAIVSSGTGGMIDNIDIRFITP